jgi:hypothetical protein
MDCSAQEEEDAYWWQKNTPVLHEVFSRIKETEKVLDA